MAPLGWATLPDALVLKSDEHWTSHSVLPGFRSQQRALQSPPLAETSVRGFNAGSMVVVIVVTIDVSVDVDVDVSVVVEYSITQGERSVDVASNDVVEPPSQKMSHSVPPPRFMLERSTQTAVQPSVVTVTTACLLARTGLPVALVALTVYSRPMRPKTTDLVIRILPMVMTLMDGKKDVQVVY